MNKLFADEKKQLPLLDFVSRLYPDTDLSNTLIIACQHILGTTYNLFEELFKKGLKPENVYLIGKCYSTNKKVFQRFVNCGINISDLSNAFDSYASFDEQFQGYIESFLQQVKENTNTKDYKKVIIIDDGGELILFTNDFFKNYGNFASVEQTTSGFEKLKVSKLSFPVFNIARSKAKLEYESPMIAGLIVNKINSYVKNNDLKNPKILVIGQGYIGKAIKKLLKKNFIVNGCDKLSKKCDFAGSYKSRLGEFDIIVGAVGKSIISAGDFGKLKDGVVLMSASSSDREFSAVYLRRLQPKTNDCHQDFVVNNIKLVNGGFPINFGGKEHSLRPEKIQLTRALLLAGVYEATSIRNQKGLKELNNNTQKQIVEKFLSLRAN